MNSKLVAVIVFSSFFIFALISSHPAYADSDPCALLTQAQVATATGMNVGPGEHKGAKLCEWPVPNQPNSIEGKKVTLTLQPGLAFNFAKAPTGHGIVKTPVSGLGDDAVYGTTPKYATTLTVKKGDLTFTVHVFGIPQDQTDTIKAMEMVLAKEVLANL
jgi:hypothetical protein